MIFPLVKKYASKSIIASTKTTPSQTVKTSAPCIKSIPTKTKETINPCRKELKLLLLISSDPLKRVTRCNSTKLQVKAKAKNNIKKNKIKTETSALYGLINNKIIKKTAQKTMVKISTIHKIFFNFKINLLCKIY